MQLVGTAKMHLARQNGAVARVAQVVAEGQHFGRHFGGVIKGANGRGQLARHEHVARRGTQRAIGIGRFKHHAPRGQRVNMRSFTDFITVGGKCRGGKLVGHQDQNIRLGHIYLSLQT